MDTLAKTNAPKVKAPFPVPAHLSPNLARVHAYWRSLLRGAATMPFADDIRLTDLPDLSEGMVLIEVFDQPERFRFAVVGAAFSSELAGRFLDDTDLDAPFEFLRAQATATVEAAAPTWFRREGERAAQARLILPAWGEGRVSLLVVAVDPV